LGKGDGQDRAETKRFVLDNDGHIVYLDHDNGKDATHEQRNYLYALSSPTGEQGHGTDGTQTTLLDTGRYNLLVNLGDEVPGAAITSYTVQDGDTLQSIAAAVYGNPSLWFVLADANGLTGNEALKAGTLLKVPNNIESGTLTGNAHRLYSESEIVDSSLPNLTAPPPKKDSCGNILMIIIVVVIAIVVTVVTAGAGAFLVGALVGATATGVAATVATIAIYAAVGAVVAAVGSIVQQGLFIALDFQKEFSWNQVGTAALSGALSGAAAGVGAVAKAAATAGTLTAQTAQWAKIAAAALKVSSVAVKQVRDSGGKITSWSSLAAAAVGGYVDAGQAINAGDATRAVLTNSKDAFETARTAASSLQTLQNVANYVTPWVQLAETYVRNDHQLKPADWANAVGSTLGQAVGGLGGDALQQGLIRNGTNLLVAGVLNHYDKDAAESYLENAIGNEVGQYIGQGLVGYAQRKGWLPEPTGIAYDAARDTFVDHDTKTSYDKSKGAFVDENGNVTFAFGRQDRERAQEQPQVQPDVSPGLLTGNGDQNESQNPTPLIDTHKLQRGESFWSLAQKQLGPDASNADIQRQVYALMELNPGLDPRTLQVGQSINLITPNADTTISAATLAAYGASDAEYQAYREEQAAAVDMNLAGGTSDQDSLSILGGIGLGARVGINVGYKGAFDTISRNEGYLDRQYTSENWELSRKGGGAFIDGRWYSAHALERMAEDTPENRSIVEERVRARLEQRGIEPGTKQYADALKDISLRGVSPAQIEAALRGEGSDRTRVTVNENGDVVSVRENRKGGGVDTKTDGVSTHPETLIERANTTEVKVARGIKGAGGLLTAYGVYQDASSLKTEIYKSVDSGEWSNTARESVRITGGWSGAWAGAEVGALSLAWAGPIGAAVGGIVGGGIGYWGGSNVATSIYDNGLPSPSLDVREESQYWMVP
jgi:LysM repeat protein